MKLPYHPPVLRRHGTLADVTAQKSGEFSDVNSKENIVRISWG